MSVRSRRVGTRSVKGCAWSRAYFIEILIYLRHCITHPKSYCTTLGLSGAIPCAGSTAGSRRGAGTHRFHGRAHDQFYLRFGYRDDSAWTPTVATTTYGEGTNVYPCVNPGYLHNQPDCRRCQVCIFAFSRDFGAGCRRFEGSPVPGTIIPIIPRPPMVVRSPMGMTAQGDSPAVAPARCGPMVIG